MPAPRDISSRIPRKWTWSGRFRPFRRAARSSVPKYPRLCWKTTCVFLQQRNLQDSYDILTEREKEVLQLLAEGKSNKEVAVILDVSVYTVDTHRTHLMQKLNLHNTAEIVLYAVRKKIIA